MFFNGFQWDIHGILLIFFDCSFLSGYRPNKQPGAQRRASLALDVQGAGPESESWGEEARAQRRG